MDVRVIIDALECLCENRHPCGRCAFNPAPGRSWQYGCVKGQADIVKAVKALLEKGGGDAGRTEG